MKYICINPFANPPGHPIVIADLKDESGKVVLKQSHVVVGEKEQKAHIHKGAIFTIGTAATFAELSPAEKTLVAHLAVEKKIAEATDATVAKVLKEVEADKARDARDAKRDTRPDPLAALADILAGIAKQNTEILAALAKK